MFIFVFWGKCTATLSSNLKTPKYLTLTNINSLGLYLTRFIRQDYIRQDLYIYIYIYLFDKIIFDNIYPPHKILKNQIHPSLTTFPSGYPHRMWSWLITDPLTTGLYHFYLQICQKVLSQTVRHNTPRSTKFLGAFCRLPIRRDPWSTFTTQTWKIGYPKLHKTQILRI